MHVSAALGDGEFDPMRNKQQSMLLKLNVS